MVSWLPSSPYVCSATDTREWRLQGFFLSALGGEDAGRSRSIHDQADTTCQGMMRRFVHIDVENRRKFWFSICVLALAVVLLTIMSG